jgi:hypothetical protein
MRRMFFFEKKNQKTFGFMVRPVRSASSSGAASDRRSSAIPTLIASWFEIFVLRWWGGAEAAAS